MKNKPAAHRATRKTAPGSSARRVRVIVADDNRDAALTLMMLLRHEGYNVRAVHKGQGIFRLIRDFQPDAVLLDIHMPGLTGYEVARTIRAHLRRELLLIGISGVYMTHADRERAVLAGFDHYVTKPYRIGDVLELLAPLRLPDA